MDRRQVSAALVLQELGIELSMDSFDERLAVQKAIYLAQEAGVRLGYFYRWYLRGPYCSGVARDLFPLVAEEGRDNELARWSLGENICKNLIKVKRLGRPPEGFSTPRWLELLASVHFLISRQKVESQNPRTIVARLKESGKDFRQQEVQYALDALRREKLLPATA